MDDQTRKAAISKANAITYMIGYPDYILDKEALDEKYKLLDVHPNEYFQNTIRCE